MEKISVELTSIQLGAVRSIILDYICLAPAHGLSYEWIDVLTDECATLGEVLMIIMAACDRAPAARQVGARAAAGDAAGDAPTGGDQVPK